MSTFSGQILEFPGISIDHFENPSSKLFFLSHCHWDHMKGLEENHDKLNGRIVLSEISAVFVKKQFGITDNQLLILGVKGSPYEIKYEYEEKEYGICVTTFPAQHCPGSVMFLLQSINKNILYTGDFRISLSRYEKYSKLKELTLHEVYLDSTFLTDDYSYFPTQVESVREICRLINDWLEQGESNKIVIQSPAQYSLEFLFMNIAKKCKQKIYVPEQLQDKYVYFKDLDDVISRNKAHSRIFLELKDKIVTHYDESVRIIKPSALFWKNLQRNQPFVKADRTKNEFRIAYSSHSSFLEILDFLRHFEPVKVFLNVANAQTIKTFNRISRTLDDVSSTFEAESEDCLEERLKGFNKRLQGMMFDWNGSEMLPKRVKL